MMQFQVFFNRFWKYYCSR